MGRLAGRTALITGAGSGIGAATAERFAREGATVALVDVDLAAASVVRDRIAAAGGRAIALRADVTDDGQIRTAVQQAVDEFGSLDILYNNAGVDSTGSVVEATEADWDRCFDVNVKGTYLTSRAAVPLLTDGGAIVNQASVAALVGVRGFAAYCAAKGAIVSLTRAMALDLAGRRIRVNAIAPGTVQTPLMEPMLRARGDGDLELGLARTVERYPIGRLGQVADVAAAAVFLASEDASFVTGAIITVDGGMTAH